jgi:Zn-dependent oligopeptidase
MNDLIQKYEDNTIWNHLVVYDFANKNHRNFAPLFEHIKNKLQNIKFSDGILGFYELKKAHRFYQFFNNLYLIVPKESQQWISTQNNQLWNIINSDFIKSNLNKLKKNFKNQELNVFFKSIFGGYQRNYIKKEKIVEKINEIKYQFEKNSKKIKAYYYFPESKKHILENFSALTISKAKKAANKRGWNGYYFTLNSDNVYKLLTYISHRKVRQQIYNKFNKSMNNCYFQIENQKLLNKSLILKKKLANYYGYNDYSDLVTSKYIITLNQTQKLLDKAKKQINQLITYYYELMQDMFKEDGYLNEDMQPWDFSYYKRKLKNKYYINTKIEEYFQFDITFPKILKQMEKLFNVSIKYINTVQKNQIYEVKDKFNNRKSAYWIVAPYLRKNEKTAYEIDLVDYANLGNNYIPWVQFIYLNLNKNGKMSFINIKNTIHEIGHAFHSFFSQNETLKETFAWDLIELPSQFLENLAYRYNFMAKISSSNYFSKKIFKQEIKNYTFNDIFYLNEKIIDFKTAFELNKNIKPYSNKKIIKQITLKRHAVGNYYNPYFESENFFNSYEIDYFSNYVYFFSENIAKQLNLIYKEKDFRQIFNNFDLDKKTFKEFIQSNIKITEINLEKMLNYNIFDIEPPRLEEHELLLQ